MKREELVQQLLKRNWVTDRFGHLQKVVKRRERGVLDLVERKFRIKLQTNSCRIEIQTVIGDRNEWIKIGGGYYKDCFVPYGGQLQVGTTIFKAVKS